MAVAECGVGPVSARIPSVSGSIPTVEAVVARLAAAGCVASEAEAVALLAEAPDAATLESWVRRREGGEPLEWITGIVRFCGHRLRIVPGVYVPRPQTEELARRAAALLSENGRALDLCTGSGAVAVHLAASVPTATVIGVDIDPRAVACARRNGVPVAAADLAAPFGPTARFDVVTAVAPYVPTDAIGLLPVDVRAHEPRDALDGGADGLDLVHRVIAVASALLRPGGWLLIEVGGDQDRVLAQRFSVVGFHQWEAWVDEDGDLRGMAAQRT